MDPTTPLRSSAAEGVVVLRLTAAAGAFRSVEVWDVAGWRPWEIGTAAIVGYPLAAAGLDRPDLGIVDAHVSARVSDSLLVIARPSNPRLFPVVTPLIPRPGSDETAVAAGLLSIRASGARVARSPSWPSIDAADLEALGAARTDPDFLADACCRWGYHRFGFDGPRARRPDEGVQAALF